MASLVIRRSKVDLIRSRVKVLETLGLESVNITDIYQFICSRFQQGSCARPVSSAVLPPRVGAWQPGHCRDILGVESMSKQSRTGWPATILGADPSPGTRVPYGRGTEQSKGVGKMQEGDHGNVAQASPGERCRASQLGLEQWGGPNGWTRHEDDWTSCGR